MSSKPEGYGPFVSFLLTMLVIILIMMFTSCVPSRDANNNYYKPWQVSKRIRAKPSNSCPLNYPKNF